MYMVVKEDMRPKVEGSCKQQIDRQGLVSHSFSSRDTGTRNANDAKNLQQYVAFIQHEDLQSFEAAKRFGKLRQLARSLLDPIDPQMLNRLHFACTHAYKTSEIYFRITLKAHGVSATILYV